MIFDSTHERFVSEALGYPQLSLNMPSETITPASVTATQQISYSRHKASVEIKSLQHPGRIKLPGNLRREEILIEPALDTTDCKKIGEEITEVLEYDPGELYVKQYRRPKYAKPGNSGVVIGSYLPVH